MLFQWSRHVHLAQKRPSGNALEREARFDGHAIDQLPVRVEELAPALLVIPVLQAFMRQLFPFPDSFASTAAVSTRRVQDELS